MNKLPFPNPVKSCPYGHGDWLALERMLAKSEQRSFKEHVRLCREVISLFSRCEWDAAMELVATETGDLESVPDSKRAASGEKDDDRSTD